MNTATVTQLTAVPRALQAGEWLGEAALSISNWLSGVAAQRRAVREANALRDHAQGFAMIDARMATEMCAAADRHEQLHGDR
jgi:hypothetical protein